MTKPAVNTNKLAASSDNLKVREFMKVSTILEDRFESRHSLRPGLTLETAVDNRGSQSVGDSSKPGEKMITNEVI